MEDGEDVTYSKRFVQLRALGTLGNNTTGVEQWSVGLKIPMDASPSSAVLQAFMSACQGAFSTFHSDTNNGFGTTVFLKQLSTAYIDVTGRYVGAGAQSTQYYTYGSPVAGAGTGVLPFSTAVVLSLRTPLSRGPGSNGRMYWPKIAVPISNTLGTWAIGEGAGLAAKTATLLNAVNAAADATLVTSDPVSVMSQVGPVTAPVTSVRVGHKPDRQERRERNISESYGEAGVSTTAQLLRDRMERNIEEF